MADPTTTAEEVAERVPNGTVIDNRYEVIGHMGRGGFADVYRARHVHLDREVAVKVLDMPDSPAASRQFRERFLQEAKIAARIKHPNVVDIFDFGFFGNRPYIAMELLEGHDLETEIATRGSVAPERLVRLFDGCLDALDEGHRLGIVHKDLKPSNLYLADAGRPSERLVLLDFGIARVFTDPGAKLTQTGGFSGTPAYLAPEYIEFQTVSPRLDVYQMGLIIIEALAGIPAVTAQSSMAYMMAHCQGEVNMPPELESSEFGPILRRATSLKPDERFASAGDLRTALIGIDPTSLPSAFAVTKPAIKIPAGLESVDVLAETNQFATKDTSDPVLPVAQPASPTQPSAPRKTTSLVALLGVLIVGLALAIAALAMWSRVDGREAPAAPSTALVEPSTPQNATKKPAADSAPTPPTLEEATPAAAVAVDEAAEEILKGVMAADSGATRASVERAAAAEPPKSKARRKPRPTRKVTKPKPPKPEPSEKATVPTAPEPEKEAPKKVVPSFAK